MNDQVLQHILHLLELSLPKDSRPLKSFLAVLVELKLHLADLRETIFIIVGGGRVLGSCSLHQRICTAQKTHTHTSRESERGRGGGGGEGVGGVVIETKREGVCETETETETEREREQTYLCAHKGGRWVAILITTHSRSRCRKHVIGMGTTSDKSRK